MILEISNEGVTTIQNGVHHFVLSDYHNIQEWEWNNILAFISYEKFLGQQLEVTCQDKALLSLVNNVAKKLDGTEYIPPIAEAIEEFVYHATNAIAAQKILSNGRLLSATKVYGKTGEELALERREMGWEDPVDFYEYIMFGWGTHLVGDYVVLSENFPKEEDFLKGSFDAGVRFYIRYEDMIKHEGHTFDGYHPIKVKDEVILSEYLFVCIVPEQYKQQIESFIPQELAKRVYYLRQRGLTLQEWNDKVVNFVRIIQNNKKIVSIT